jgi:hypothetical protein
MTPIRKLSKKSQILFKMRKLYSIFFAVIFFAGCSKDNNESIPTLSATFNSGSWTAFTIDTHLDYYTYNRDMFYIRATTKDEQELYINIYSIASGKYYINQYCSVSYTPSVSNFLSDRFTANTGELNLTVDTVKNEISGTFEFVLKNQNNFSDSIVVTNGSFNNLRYSYLIYKK